MKNQFKGRHFTAEIILFCLRWYLQSPLSYQQVADLVTERGFKVNKSTVWRWVQCYAPKLKYKLKKYLKCSTTVHHYDETYIKVRGKLRYLYRAIDSNGNTLDFVLSIKKDKSSAIQFLRRILSQDYVAAPGTIVTDKNPSYSAAISSLKKDNTLKSISVMLNISGKIIFLNQIIVLLKGELNIVCGFKNCIVANVPVLVTNQCI